MHLSSKANPARYFHKPITNPKAFQMTSKVLTSLRVKALKKIFEQLQLGQLQVTFPNGDSATYIGKQSGPSADITLSSPFGVKQMLQNGRIGFCEAYMAGEIESNNLAGLIELGSLHSELLSKDLNRNILKQALSKIIHFGNRNSKSGSRKNIAYHYDLGNN